MPSKKESYPVLVSLTTIAIFLVLVFHVFSLAASTITLTLTPTILF